MENFAVLIERFLRFSKYLPSGGERDLIVLKGHLLIEEVISEIIGYHLDRSNPLGIDMNSNLMFNQKLNLCWALVGAKFEKEFWQSVKLLNSIRNAMAHSLSPNDLEQKLKLFTDGVIKNSDFANQGYQGKDLEFSIAWLFVGFSRYLDSLKSS